VIGVIAVNCGYLVANGNRRNYDYTATWCHTHETRFCNSTLSWNSDVVDLEGNQSRITMVAIWRFDTLAWDDADNLRRSRSLPPHHRNPKDGCLSFAGDGARRDQDGYFWVMGRVDDVINVSGHRLGTMEVESALVSHPAVAEAAVVSKPDEVKGKTSLLLLPRRLSPTR